MTNLSFAQEHFSPALWAELLPLLAEHWQEIAHYPDIPLAVEQATYDAADAAGLVRLYTARDTSGALLGYACFFVRPNPHYATSLQASQDVLFLHPSARGGSGARFIAWCDEQLQAEGVQAVYHHVKSAHNFGPLLERMGYQLVDLIYARRLDGGPR